MSINIEQEILDWFNDNEIDETKESIGSYVWEEFYGSLRSKDQVERTPSFTTATLASGPAYLVEDFGGEGQGVERWVVFSVGGQFFEADGYYASWDGTTWEDPTPYEVEAVQVMVTQYQKKRV